MHYSIKIGWHTFERKVFFVITHSKKQGKLIFKGGPIYFFGEFKEFSVKVCTLTTTQAVLVR